MTRTGFVAGSSVTVMYIALALVLVSSGGSARGACYLCTPLEGGGWACPTASAGGKGCTIDDRGCLNINSCTETQPPPVAPKPQQASFYLYSITGGSFTSFPAQRNLSVAHDAASIRGAVAETAGVEVSAVDLRGWLNFVSHSSFDPGRIGWIVGGSQGFMVRRDVNEDDTMRLRICSFVVGASPDLVADVVVPATGQTVLVPLQLSGEQAVLGIREKRFTQSEWEAQWGDEAYAFYADVAESLVEPWGAPTAAQAAGPCE